MDSLIAEAARALAVGDPLGALKRVALRDDAPSLALRGIAMAQLGDFSRAKVLLHDAARAFGPHHALARARCVVAEAEIALASRDLGWPEKALDLARVTLERHGDLANAAYARNLEVRRLLLIGRLNDADQKLAEFDPSPLPPGHRAAHELAVAGIAIRRLRTKVAREALTRAKHAALQARIPSLIAEVQHAISVLDQPAARLVRNGDERMLLLDEVEALLESNTLAVDACRNVVREQAKVVSLAKRPVLFEIVRALAEAWPGDVSRDALVERAFGWKVADDTYRPLLRVEMTRLRAEIRPLADVIATKRGFALVPRVSRDVVVLAPPVEEQFSSVLALLADGESWSSSGVALALGTSQRTIQRALDSLVATGKVQWIGRGRARRWVASTIVGFTTTLLLPTQLPL